MAQSQRFTAIIEREDDGYVALCPEVDIASQGSSIEEARTNLVEALTLFFDTAASSEVKRRVRSEVFVTQVEAPVGLAPGFCGLGDLPDSGADSVRIRAATRNAP